MGKEVCSSDRALYKPKLGVQKEHGGFEEMRVVRMFGWRTESRGSLGKAKVGW